MGRRVEIGADQSLGRARLLDLRDEAKARCGRGIERAAEPPGRRLRGGAGVERRDAACRCAVRAGVAR